MAKFRGKIQDGTIDIPDLIIKIALIWFILTFLVFPNVNLLLRVFVKDEHFTMEAVSKIMRSARAMKSLPFDGVRKPTSALKDVVFPQPLGPRKVKNSPSLMSRFRLSMATKSPYLISIFSYFIMVFS